jgi:hypothetical protein
MRRLPASAFQKTSTVSPGTPSDAEKVHAEILAVESVLPKLPDRGAALFLLARQYARVGDLQKALALLKECVVLDAGFEPDPNNSPSLQPLASNREFRELLERVRRRYRPVHKAHVAFSVPAADLFPEGLAVDASNQLFCMGSMHRKKIVKFTLTSGVSDFVKEDVWRRS